MKKLLLLAAAALAGCANLKPDYAAPASGPIATVDIGETAGVTNRRILVHGPEICSVEQSKLVGIVKSKAIGVDTVERHVITANEGSAVALAAGHYLATGELGLVYLQNSGLGNTVNPLTSLADADVYGIPMLVMIGWRGEPGTEDEPQHVKMGKVTARLLDAIGVPHWVLPGDEAEAAQVLEQRPAVAG